jgi:hypothetical protein
MAPHDDPGASARRLSKRAAWLVLPAALVALAGPRVVGHLRHRVSAAAVASPPGAAASPAERAAPPEPSTPERIEAAAAAQVALGKAQRGWERVTVIAPREGRPEGEEVLPFDGFALAVESAPDGAGVLLDGRHLGETPVMTSVSCAVGQVLRLRVEKAPLPAREATVSCRANALVKLRVRLEAAQAR